MKKHKIKFDIDMDLIVSLSYFIMLIWVIFNWGW